MVQKRDVPGIRPYDAPAGGWGRPQGHRDRGAAIRWNWSRRRSRCCGPTSLTGSIARAAPGPTRSTPPPSSSAKTAPRPSPGRRPASASRRSFFAAHTVTELLGWSDFHLENEGRLTHPLAYDAASDTYQPIDWDDAFARIGETLRALPDPDMAEFYTSGRASNEAAFLFQIFAREYGSNNFPDCSNMCHEATSVGLPQSIGIGKGTVSLDDFDHCELIIAMGHNPGTNHPRMMGTLWRCRDAACRSSCSIPARARAGALRRSAGPDRDGDARLDPDRLDLLPAEGRRRRRGAQGHHEGADRDG